MRQSCTFLGAVGGGLQDMAPPLRELKELSSLEWLSLILRPVLHKSAADTFTGQFQTLIDSNNFTVQNALSIKRKAV